MVWIQPKPSVIMIIFVVVIFKGLSSYKSYLRSFIIDIMISKHKQQQKTVFSTKYKVKGLPVYILKSGVSGERTTFIFFPFIIP